MNRPDPFELNIFEGCTWKFWKWPKLLLARFTHTGKVEELKASLKAAETRISGLVAECSENEEDIANLQEQLRWQFTECRRYRIAVRTIELAVKDCVEEVTP